MGMTIAIDKLYINKMPQRCKECPLTYLDTGDDAYFGANERRCVIDNSCVDGMGSERAYDCPLVEAIPKADYEARLKADMVAMLTEIMEEATKERFRKQSISYESEFGYLDYDKIIKQKIDNLKKDRNKCIDCEYFSDKEYYADNSIFVSAVAFGSCAKCQRNFTSSDPYNEIPSWCPIKKKEQEDGKA